MTLDQRLTHAVREVANGVTPPDVDLDVVRARARANRRRAVSLAVSAVVVTAVAAGTVAVAGRDTSAPLPPVEPPPPTAPIEVDPPPWLGDLGVGPAPLTPYWHDGVLHARGVEIETPFPVGQIEVAGDTVLVGGRMDEGGRVEEWALVRGDRLEPLPVEGWGAQLSVDGRIAFWEVEVTAGGRRFVAWDTETNTELASRTPPGTDDGTNRLQMIGIDADGIAYWVNQSIVPPVTRWDVRADTVEPTDVAFDFSKAFDDQPAPIPDLWVGFEDAYVSPDGTREVFTGPAPGDSPEHCCTGQLRVRPVGPVESVAPRDVVTLRLPEGIPNMRLWDAYSDRGMWWVWWESNETVLLDASREGHSYLVRCSTTNGTCKVVFDLGPDSSKGIMYLPDWERDWAFARFPVPE